MAMEKKMRRVIYWGFMVALATALSACTTGAAPPGKAEAKSMVEEVSEGADEGAREGSRAPEPPESALLEGVTVDPEVCGGALVPPQGHRQETAFVPLTTSNAVDVAAQTARARLRDMICKGYRCEHAEEIIRIWRVGHDGQKACVMAVARESRIQEFISAPRRSLEDGLMAVAHTIGQSLEAIPEEDLRPAVFIASIEDNGVNGGPRAEWLYDQLLVALAQKGVDVIRPPAHWTGLGVPAESRGILRGTIHQLPGQEAMLEAIWHLELDDHRVRGVGNVQFPQAISPEVDPATYMPPLPRGDGTVAVHLDSRPGGALCDGQQTELWLESSEPLHVRVINLYGRGEGGLVIYATEDEPLAANYPISLGQFQAVKAGEVGVERFLVVAAPTKAELERFSTIGQVCRLPSSVAQGLHRGEHLPQQALKWTTSLDYRLMSGEGCEDIEPARAADLAALERLPTCW